MTREEREEYWREIIATRRPWDTAKAFAAAIEERDNLLRKARKVIGTDGVVWDIDAAYDLDSTPEAAAVDAEIRELLGEHA